MDDKEYIDAMLHSDDPDVIAELAAMHIDGEDDGEEESPKAAEVRKRMIAEALRQMRKKRPRG